MCAELPSVLWRCWLGGRKGIQPVKNSSGVVLAWLSVWSEMQTCIWPRWCHYHSLSLASVKSRLILPFWYPTHPGSPWKRAVKRVCVCVHVQCLMHHYSCLHWHSCVIPVTCCVVVCVWILQMTHLNNDKQKGLLVNKYETFHKMYHDSSSLLF